MMTLAARALALAVVLAAAGCAAKPPAATPEASPEALLGTWRLESVTDKTGDERDATAASFVQFYPDGTVAAWSASDGGIVANGRYRIRDGKLVYSLAGAAGMPFGVTGSTLWYEKENGERAMHRRVRPDLMPGRIPNAK